MEMGSGVQEQAKKGRGQRSSVPRLELVRAGSTFRQMQKRELHKQKFCNLKYDESPEQTTLAPV